MLSDSVLFYIRENCQGRDKAITARKLTRIMQDEGYHTSERDVREVISTLRKSGKPIASAVIAPAGYFMPATESECLEVLHQLSSRLREISLASRGIERGLKKMFGSQMSLNI